MNTRSRHHGRRHGLDRIGGAFEQWANAPAGNMRRAMPPGMQAGGQAAQFGGPGGMPGGMPGNAMAAGACGPGGCGFGGAAWGAPGWGGNPFYPGYGPGCGPYNPWDWANLYPWPYGPLSTAVAADAVNMGVVSPAAVAAVAPNALPMGGGALDYSRQMAPMQASGMQAGFVPGPGPGLGNPYLLGLGIPPAPYPFAWPPPPGWNDVGFPIFPPQKFPNRICQTIIGIDTSAGIPANSTVKFEIESEDWFKTCTLFIPSHAAQCLTVESVVVDGMELVEGPINARIFDEQSQCCPAIGCKIAFPGDTISVTLTNNSNAAQTAGDLVALIGERLTTC